MTQQYYCPVCGKQMRQQIQKAPRGDITMIDCTDTTCNLYMATTSPNCICNGQYIKTWKYTPVYDYSTGEKLK